MASYSVADAKNQLSNLIDRALSGEGVVITRHGKPMVELKAVQSPPRPVTQADIDWLDEQRMGWTPIAVDAGTQVSEMREEDAARFDVGTRNWGEPR
jgi:prevent-host-death family protein